MRSKLLTCPMRLTSRPLYPLAWLILGLVALGTPQANASDPAPAVVRAVLFHGPDCGECEEVFDFLLPALLAQYREQLEIAAFDTSQAGGAGLLRAAMQRGLVKEPAVLPVVLTGSHSFSGLMAIAINLGDNFETLARLPEATRWPEIEGLDALLPEGLSDLRGRLALAPPDEPYAAQGQASPPSERIANSLAVVVLVVMVVALLHSLIRVRRPWYPTGANGTLVAFVLLVGLSVSAYTAYTSLAGVAPMCGPIGSCAAVQNSEYAKLFGVPMGVLGLLGYSAILLSWPVARRLSPQGGAWRWVPWAIALFGVFFSIRLTALEPFVIGHTCLWCLGSALSITTALWLLSGETRGPLRSTS
jgi:uncharacterized membrane protein